MQALPASFILEGNKVEMMECKQTAGARNEGAVPSEQGSLLPALLSAAYPRTLGRAELQCKRRVLTFFCPFEPF